MDAFKDILYWAGIVLFCIVFLGLIIDYPLLNYLDYQVIVALPILVVH